VTSTSKTQIDRLGERLKKGQVSEDDLRQLDSYRESFAEAYEEVLATVRQVLAAVRSSADLDLTGRDRKTRFSIIEKLRREKTMKLSQMQDIAGCRFVVADIPEQDRVVERLSRAFATKPKVIDRRQQPSHGYRAVHVIATARGKVVEIQVRTELQNQWAQLSEKVADRFDARIKYGAGNSGILDILSLYSGYVANVEAVEGERGGSKLLRPSANRELDNQKAQLRESLDELEKMFKVVPPRVN
jgi:GTP pyrophosphokinase